MVRAERKVERLLLVIDGSTWSLKAVEYASNMLRRRRGFLIYLLHLLPPLPSELREFGGAEDPRKEQRLGAELRRDQRQWIAAAQESAKPSLEEAAKVLRKSGFAEHGIVRQFSYPTEPRDAARTVLEYAREPACHTVVLGHKAHSWFRELAGADLTEQILRHASGISIWVVQ